MATWDKRIWEKYADKRHSRWVENEKFQIYHYWLVYAAAVFLWFQIVINTMTWLKLRPASEPNALLISTLCLLLLVPAGIYAVWLRNRRNQIIAKNLVPKPAL